MLLVVDDDNGVRRSRIFEKVLVKKMKQSKQRVKMVDGGNENGAERR